MLALLTDTDEPFSQAQYAPGHITASAFVLSEDAKAILLIWHRKLKRWLQPGGHIEPADTSVLGAAQRELAEETGLGGDSIELHAPGIFDIDVHVIPARKEQPDHRHYDIRYCFRANVSVDSRPQGGEEKTTWFSLTGKERLELGDASLQRALQQLS